MTTQITLEDLKFRRTSQPYFPEVAVQLTGSDGNAFAIMGAVGKALRKFGCDQLVVRDFQQEAMAGDYNQLLMTCMRWVDVS